MVNTASPTNQRSFVPSANTKIASELRFDADFFETAFRREAINGAGVDPERFLEVFTRRLRIGDGNFNLKDATDEALVASWTIADSRAGQSAYRGNVANGSPTGAQSIGFPERPILIFAMF